MSSSPPHRDQHLAGVTAATMLNAVLGPELSQGLKARQMSAIFVLRAIFHKFPGRHRGWLRLRRGTRRADRGAGAKRESGVTGPRLGPCGLGCGCGMWDCQGKSCAVFMLCCAVLVLFVPVPCVDGHGHGHVGFDRGVLRRRMFASLLLPAESKTPSDRPLVRVSLCATPRSRSVDFSGRCICTHSGAQEATQTTVEEKKACGSASEMAGGCVRTMRQDLV